MIDGNTFYRWGRLRGLRDFLLCMISIHCSGPREVFLEPLPCLLVCFLPDQPILELGFPPELDLPGSPSMLQVV